MVGGQALRSLVHLSQVSGDDKQLVVLCIPTDPIPWGILIYPCPGVGMDGVPMFSSPLYRST